MFGSLVGQTARPAYRKIPSGSLHVSKPTWWLTSRFHFSFADYFNVNNMNFGALRVLNDDLVKPYAGFGKHPHRNAEIFSYIVDGWLTHQDSMGNKESLPRGCVQYLSAGTGIWHSEMNDHSDTCRFLQIWLTPRSGGLPPQYGSRQFTKADRHNRMLHILGGTGEMPTWGDVSEPSQVTLQQDANVFVSESDAGVVFDARLAKGRQAYVVCIEGSMTVGDEELGMRDACEVYAGEGEVAMKLQAGDQGAHFMVIEMEAE